MLPPRSSGFDQLCRRFQVSTQPRWTHLLRQVGPSSAGNYGVNNPLADPESFRHLGAGSTTPNQFPDLDHLLIGQQCPTASFTLHIIAPAFRIFIPAVIQMRSNGKMSRIATRRIVAGMKKNFVLRDRPNCQRVRYTVGPLVSTSETNRPVTNSVSRPLPFPTIFRAFFLHPTPKRGHWVGPEPMKNTAPDRTKTDGGMTGIVKRLAAVFTKNGMVFPPALQIAGMAQLSRFQHRVTTLRTLPGHTITLVPTLLTKHRTNVISLSGFANRTSVHSVSILPHTVFELNTEMI